MEDYVNFDRQDIGQASLDEACSCLLRIHENEHLWQYAIISIHNALQCYLSIALRGGSGIATWKKRHAKKWLKAYRADEELPDTQLDFFMELYDKLFINKQTEKRDLVKWLNETRNEFIHFNSDSFSVHEPLMLSACQQALEDIQLTLSLSKGIVFYNEEQRAKFNTSCKELSFLLEKFNKSSKRNALTGAPS